MEGFDQFLIRGVRIIFWKGPSLVMEERQLLGEVMLKYPLLFSLLPEDSREDAMGFLKKKMLELGMQQLEELNCFRVMGGHLYWQMTRPTHMSDFELALEEFLFRQRLESAVTCLHDSNCESRFQGCADDKQSEEVPTVTMETEYFKNGDNVNYPFCRTSQEDSLSETYLQNNCREESLEEGDDYPIRPCFGMDIKGSFEKNFDPYTRNFHHAHRAIQFPPGERIL